MKDFLECEGKTVDEAIAEALERLSITKAEAEVTVLQEPSAGLFGFFGKRAKVMVSKKDTDAADDGVKIGEPQRETAGAEHKAPAPAAPEALTEAQEGQVERGIAFVHRIVDCMGLTIDVAKKETEHGILLMLTGDDVGILIGKHGQTLDALQYLTGLAANRGVDEGRIHVVLDVDGYRARREETLVRLATHLAEKAVRIGRDVYLEPMNRHERRIIHTTLMDNGKVMTHSAGEEPRRYVVITPKERRRRGSQEGAEGARSTEAPESTSKTHLKADADEPLYERGEY